MEMFLLRYISLFICIFPHCYGRRGYSQDYAKVSFDNMIVCTEKKNNLAAHTDIYFFLMERPPWSPDFPSVSYYLIYVSFH